ncbi:hypothetical protein COI93_19170 [Bacillus cereus]|uniref:Uncharacterized protein n=2 Tax=Bacillus cereus TaxID=1396 RepID=A0A2B0LWM4_BACCE|nr:hypothetical protein COI93_19170 [Bacillus cereus]
MFDEIGDRIHSKFMRDFNIDFIDYNQDLLESTLIENSTTSLTNLLNGYSYEAEILSQFVEHYGEELPETYDSIIRGSTNILTISYAKDNSLDITSFS